MASTKLEECETAKTSLETGSSSTPGDSRFTSLIKECDQRISASPPKKPLKNKQREACGCQENQQKASSSKGNRQKAPKPNSKSRVANDKVMDPKLYFENRMKFLGEQKDSGINPYPHKFFVTMSITEYKEKFVGLDNGDRLENVQVSLAGRIMSVRK